MKEYSTPTVEVIELQIKEEFMTIDPGYIVTSDTIPEPEVIPG